MHVVILVHGIRDRARWEASLSEPLKSHGFTPVPINYGRFGALEFLLPIPFFRNRAVRDVRGQIADVRKQYPEASLSVIAHSFGTWVIAKILQDGFFIRFHRIIFCGSVVPYNFPFEQFSERFCDPILNEVGDCDPWPAVAESATWGYGSAGTYGFLRNRVQDRWHASAGHGYFLNNSFCECYWISFLRDGKIIPGNSEASPPLWVRAVSWAKLKYLAILAILATLYAAGVMGNAQDVVTAALQYRERQLMRLHWDETPIQHYVLEYRVAHRNARQGESPKVEIEIFNNADIAVTYLKDQHWVEFKADQFHPIISLATLFIPSADAQEPVTAATEDPQYIRVSIISKCQFLCVKDHSYTYRVNPDLVAEVLERDGGGAEVSKTTRALDNIGDIFRPLKLKDLYEGGTIPTSKEMNFRKAAHVPDGERLYALVDATLFGSAVNGVAFGEKSFYVNGGWPTPPFSVRYSDLRNATIEVGGSYRVSVDGKEISIPGSEINGYQLSSILELIKAIARECTDATREICRSLRN
jgi:hypothetical protein